MCHLNRSRIVVGISNNYMCEIDQYKSWGVGESRSWKVGEMRSREVGKFGRWGDGESGSWKVGKMGSWGDAESGSWKVHSKTSHSKRLESIPLLIPDLLFI